MADFPDVNVWVALSAEDHPHHGRAKRYWSSEAQRRLCFCRVTALGLIRVICHRHTFGGAPLTPQEAWACYMKWRSFTDIEILAEPAGVEDILADWTAQGLATSRNWTDLYLGAFALAGRHRFVTFDRDFDRLPGLSVLRLEV